MKRLSCGIHVPYTYVIFASINFCKLLEMHSGKSFTDFFFRGPEGQIRNFFYLAHVLCSCTCQYECDDVLDGFWGPGDGCRSDTGNETVPGQTFAVWSSFANIAKICTARKSVRIQYNKFS